MTLADEMPVALQAELRRDPEGRAILVNFAAEDRVSAATSAFAVAVAHAHNRSELQDACRGLTRRLPCLDRVAAVSQGATWYNHVADTRFRKYGLLDTGVIAGARPFQVPPDYFEYSPGVPRALWTSPFTDSSPDVVVAHLGLAHFYQHLAMFRMAVEPADTAVELFIPTVFDSDVAWQWRRPPAGHADPWGLTLNLDTCAEGAPELIAVAPPALRLAQPLGKPMSDPSTNCLAGGAP